MPSSMRCRRVWTRFVGASADTDSTLKLAFGHGLGSGLRAADLVGEGDLDFGLCLLLSVLPAVPPVGRFVPPSDRGSPRPGVTAGTLTGRSRRTDSEARSRRGRHHRREQTDLIRPIRRGGGDGRVVLPTVKTGRISVLTGPATAKGCCEPDPEWSRAALEGSSHPGPEAGDLADGRVVRRSDSVVSQRTAMGATQ